MRVDLSCFRENCHEGYRDGDGGMILGNKFTEDVDG